MKKNILHRLILGLLISGGIQANDSVTSELSHVGGGVVLAGLGTVITDRYFSKYREYRGWIGFWSATLITGIISGIEYAQDTDDASGELLDFASGVAGAAIGSFVTDRFILSPIIHSTPDGSHTMGVNVFYKF